MKNKKRKQAQTTSTTVHTHTHERQHSPSCVCRRGHGRIHSGATTHSSRVLLNIYMYRTKRYFVHCVAQNVFTFRRMCRCEYCCVWDSTLAMAKVHIANDRLSDFHSSPIENAIFRARFQSFASDKIRIFEHRFQRQDFYIKPQQKLHLWEGNTRKIHITVYDEIHQECKMCVGKRWNRQQKSGFQSELAASLRLLVSNTDEILIADEITKTGKKIYERRKCTRNAITKLKKDWMSVFGFLYIVSHSFYNSLSLHLPLSASVFRRLLACLDDGKKCTAHSSAKHFNGIPFETRRSMSAKPKWQESGKKVGRVKKAKKDGSQQ